MKKIILTGGGSAGHVTVNLALIPRFLQDGWTVEYIGSNNGIEKQLISSLADVTYHEVSTGKIRRYFDWQNIKDPFKVVKGVFQACLLIKKQQPHVVFSKGGFVSVPVVLASWLNRVPVIIHESDCTPGLANRVSMPFATAICTTFPDTEKLLPEKKNHYVGPIVREEVKQGSAERGRQFCQITDKKPILLVIGGSLGSRSINQTIRKAIAQIVTEFQVIHLCGKGQVDSSIQLKDYKQYEYINEELGDVLAMSDIVISRAGSNVIFELLTLRKPMLLIPLSKQQSRGDQLRNAQSFQESGFCEVIFEEQLSVETLISTVTKLFESRGVYKKRMEEWKSSDSLSDVISIIKRMAK